MPSVTGANDMEPSEGYNSVFSADSITKQDREAAEVLLLMGNAGARKTIISEHISVVPVTNNFTTDSNSKNNQSVNTHTSEPVGNFTFANHGTFSNHFNGLKNFGNNYNVPISVVKRHEMIGSRPQRIYPSSPPISMPFRDAEIKHPSGMPSWIVFNGDNSQGCAAGVIRIVSPNQNTLGGNGSNGQTTMPLLHFNSNNNPSDYFQSNSRILNKNLEHQKLHHNKLMKKDLRAKFPLNRDATKAIIVDGFTIPREFWAKAFMSSDICHAAGILFKALFTPEEIQNCTLRGRNGTCLLDLQKRSAIFRAVGWMKNKNQNPYSFDSKQLNNYNNTEFLTPEEKLIIEKKVFVERRYQTSRKIREVPYTRKQNNAIKRSSPQKKNNSNCPVSSNESNPPVEIIVKAEPNYVLENYSLSNNQENQMNSSVTLKEEPIDTDEDIKISVDNPVGHSEENKPPSPKQMKFAAY